MGPIARLVLSARVSVLWSATPAPEKGGIDE